jgi:hypothetical protein
VELLDDEPVDVAHLDAVIRHRIVRTVLEGDSGASTRKTSTSRPV